MGDNIGLMDRSLYDLLFFGIEVLREVLVERGLLLLEACLILAHGKSIDVKLEVIRNRACLNML